MKMKFLLLLLINITFYCIEKKENCYNCKDSLFNITMREINIDSVYSYISKLQNFKTRYLIASNKDTVSSWIRNKFSEFGYSTIIEDTFTCKVAKNNDTVLTVQKNIIAVCKSSIDTEISLVIGAHYDSIVNSGNPLLVAPGADDNASGLAGLLEIARVIKKTGEIFPCNIIFIAFSAEETGRPSGSGHYALNAKNSDQKIKLMINLDMIGYSNDLVDNSKINISYYTEFIKYRNYAKHITNKYSKIKAMDGYLVEPGDSYSFYGFGYPAIAFNEHDFNPNYHRETDLLEYINMDYCTEVVKASCATLLSFIDMPETEVSDFIVKDGGDGSSLFCQWQKNKDFNVAGYNIYLGKESVNYDTAFTTIDTALTITNLIEGKKYFVGITAFDSLGNESFIVEKTGTPYSLPLPAYIFTDEPEMHKIILRWNKNYEYDLAGYNIYRSNTTEGEKVKLNELVIMDTTFIDNTAYDGLYYYYTVKAIDKNDNESIGNPILKSRVVSLDQGILVVDETADGNGLPMKPTDELVDIFYDSTLTNFNIKHYDIIKEGGLKLADIGAFSTILWHGNDNIDYLSASIIQNDLRKYLNFGGKLFYNGYYPTKAFGGQINYPKDFSAGEFVYDYIKISHSDLKFGARFRGAIKTSSNYNSLFIDSSKTLSSQEFHLINIESLSAAPGATNIYLYDTQYDSTTSQGSMKGMPVGVEYLGSDYKVITLSFPLYYINQEQAKELVQYIMLNKFNEITSVDERKEEKEITTEFKLFQNYPNPFNPTTVINYQLPKASNVTLKIYDVLGKEVTTLVNEEKHAGNYEVEFSAEGGSASGGNGYSLSSGMYFYQLRAGEFVSAKKMLIIK